MSIEERVLKVINDVAIFDNLTLDTNFADSGIDSLTSIEIMLEIEKEFNIEYPTDSEPPATVNDVVAFIKSRLDN